MEPGLSSHHCPCPLLRTLRWKQTTHHLRRCSISSFSRWHLTQEPGPAADSLMSHSSNEVRREKYRFTVQGGLYTHSRLKPASSFLGLWSSVQRVGEGLNVLREVQSRGSGSVQHRTDTQPLWSPYVSHVTLQTADVLGENKRTFPALCLK